MNIGFLYNVRLLSPSLTDKEAQVYAEFDSPQTIAGITSAIEAHGHRVWGIEANEKAYGTLKSLKRQGKIDLAFNIAEGLCGEAREAQIPAMLEMLQIPYTGSGPLNLAITLNKARTKEILSYYHIPNPSFQVYTSPKNIPSPEFGYPLIVKPLNEGSSKGIRNNCVIQNPDELNNRVREIIKEFNQPVIAEKFLPGREFTVGLIETSQGPQVLPIIEVSFEHLPPEINKIDSYEVKWIQDSPANAIDPLTCPARISSTLESQIRKISLDTFRVLDCKDLARIDIRLDKNDSPNILEVNSLPGLIPDPKENSRFPYAARAAGISYNSLIGMILDSAIRRYQLR